MSMKKTLEALIKKLRLYAKKADTLKGEDGYDVKRLERIKENCLTLTELAPQTFEQALQLG